MIELTIDDKKISTEKGTTILRAALDNGIKIPNLCYDKRILPYGGCRVCIVEIEGNRKLEASCATLASDGMVVRTNTPKVRKVRQTVLEFMAVHHPLECPVCDKAGECDFQDLVFQYGKPDGRFIRAKKQAPPDMKGSLIELNSQRCILCAKCVRICAEHQGQGALGLMGRGFPTVVNPAFNKALECDYCGQCIDVCPTGAILNKSVKFKARPWHLEEKDTICPFCGCGCTLTLGVKDGKILRSRGKEDRGINEGSLCGRGRFGIDFIYSENRLKSPMIRDKGVLEPATWEEAFGYISERLQKIKDKYGPSSVGAIGSPRCTNEENYIFQKFMREVIGTNNIDSSASFGYGLVEKAWKMAFGQGGHRIDLKAPLGKDVVLVLESDPSVTHPVFGLNILKAKREGSRLIVVDSKKTKMTKHSTEWVKIKQGTSVALLNGIMRIMLDKGLVDREQASKVAGFPALEQSLKEYDPEMVAKLTGIGEEELLLTAETIAKAESRMICFSLGVSENTKGMDMILAAANLVNLLGDSPESIQVPAEYANTFGLHIMGVRPDAVSADESVGKGVPEMLYEHGSLKALYVMGADPAVSFPDTSRIVEGLKSLDFLIVQDIALTETAELAHVVLPAAAWAEKDGTFTNAEGVTQSIVKTVNPPGSALTDWQIIGGLASAMGCDIGQSKREDIMGAIKPLIDKRQDASPVTRAFNPVDYVPGEEPDSEYPLNMVVRDVLQHAGSMSTRSHFLKLVVPEAILEISRIDAENYHIVDGCHVKVTSRRGAAYIKAAVSGDVPEGTVYVPAHFPHSGICNLTRSARDKGNPVDVVRIEKQQLVATA